MFYWFVRIVLSPAWAGLLSAESPALRVAAQLAPGSTRQAVGSPKESTGTARLWREQVLAVADP